MISNISCIIILHKGRKMLSVLSPVYFKIMSKILQTLLAEGYTGCLALENSL